MQIACTVIREVTADRGGGPGALCGKSQALAAVPEQPPRFRLRNVRPLARREPVRPEPGARELLRAADLIRAGRRVVALAVSSLLHTEAEPPGSAVFRVGNGLSDTPAPRDPGLCGRKNQSKLYKSVDMGSDDRENYFPDVKKARYAHAKFSGS